MKYCSLDIESCNGQAHKASMCSFGYALADDSLSIYEQKDLLINPLPKKFMLGRPGETSRIELAYTEEQFRAAPRFFARYREIRDKIRDSLVVGFSLGNDLKYLNNACDVFRMPRIPFRYIDVQVAYMAAHGSSLQRSLGSLAEEYGIGFVAHRSDEDARVTLEVLSRLAAEFGGLDALVERFGIVYGENRPDGYTDCYSRAVFDGEIGTRSRKMRTFLFTEFLKTRVRVKEGPLVGKRVALDEEVELSDVNASRRLVAAIYAAGGRVVPAGDCNLFVARKAEGNRLAYVRANVRRAEIVPEAEFLASLGPLPEVVFRDSVLLAAEFCTHPMGEKKEKRGGKGKDKRPKQDSAKPRDRQEPPARKEPPRT